MTKRMVLALLFTMTLASHAYAGTFVETPFFADRVSAGTLPPVQERIPEAPAIADFSAPGMKPGRHGGDLRVLMGKSKDTKRMVVYGYARLVGYERDFNLAPDILDSFDIKEGRIFTFHLRKGHKWSDGEPFTAEDFRYFWEDFATNKEVSKGGPPVVMLVDGEAPVFEILGETTVRYTWSKPNPHFLAALAGASPLYIYRPAHYMKRFHKKYAKPDQLEKLVKQHKQRNWVALQYNVGRQYKNNNPDLPTLQPWVLTTRPPSDRFVFERNAYFHRVDANGLQLPYIDRWIMGIAATKLIPAKVGTGDSDLQAHALAFNNATFLKESEKRNDYTLRLWRTARGSQIALFPNLNTTDEAWRPLVRDPNFRRALSLAVDREDINDSVYFGMAIESNNTVLPASPLYDEKYTTKWATFDPDKANKLLDGMGLTKRNDDGIRLLPNGAPMELILESASEQGEQADVLQLIGESWYEIGIKLHSRILQRETFRNRVFSGATVMSAWSGLENGVPGPHSSPDELAPTSQMQYHWPKWGQHYETGGKAGSPIDLTEAKELSALNAAWMRATSPEQKQGIWKEMLDIYCDQVFSIGTVSGILQPVVVSNRLRNVPEEGIYNWDPGSHFGIYRPDTFWFADGGQK
jgi:peptide/nickel transport system substrate-binding protein